MTEYERFIQGKLPGLRVLYADEHFRVVVFSEDATDEQKSEALSGWGFEPTGNEHRCVFFTSGVFSPEPSANYAFDPLSDPSVESSSTGSMSLTDLLEALHLHAMLPVVVNWLMQRVASPEDAAGNTDVKQSALMGLFLLDQKALKEVLPPEEATEFLATLPLQARIEAVRAGMGGEVGDLSTVDATFEPDGVKFYFSDWSDDDLLNVFSDEGRHRTSDRENATQVFAGDNYDWFDSDYLDPIEDVLRYTSLTKEVWAAVGAALVANESEMALDSEDTDAGTGPVTADTLASEGVERCLLAVSEHNADDPVAQAVVMAYSRASQDARSNECQSSYVEAVEDVLGSKGTYEGNRLMFKLSYSFFGSLLEGYLDDNGEAFYYSKGSSIAHLVQYVADKASVRHEFDASPSNAEFSSAVLDMLNEL